MTTRGSAGDSPVKGQIACYQSRVDGTEQPYAVCATDAHSDPKPLVIEVSPGAINDLPGAVSLTAEIAEIAARNGRSCVVARPVGRGPGSVYQGYGEVDVLEVIEQVDATHGIDRERITITGASMGGAAVWYLISHYPDLFAGAAPFCGYCDYRLWEKPGGATFQMREWEEPSWKGRSAALLCENLEHTPVWIVHGEWDRGVGGGVPVEHSRQMARSMAARGFVHTYTEVPETGHNCRVPKLWEEVIGWLLDQRKEQHPQHIAHGTWSLRHNRFFWVSIEQLDRYGERGLVDATVDGGRLDVSTEGVRAFSVNPDVDGSRLEVAIDGRAIGAFEMDGRRTFRQDPGTGWQAGPAAVVKEKRPGCSGPIGDLFFDGTILVPGTVGSEEETFQNRWVADDAVGYFRSRNGGVHRGGIMGETSLQLPVVADTELSDENFTGHNLVLYGTPESNAVFARLRDHFPLSFSASSLTLAGTVYEGKSPAVFALFPHPGNPQRYVAIHGGTRADAICWGSHLDMQLLPDYLVYDGGQVLDWGFYDNGWGQTARS